MKAVGLLTVFLAASAAGFIKADTYKSEGRVLGGFIDLVYFIKREISSYLTPQYRIYEKFENDTLEKIGFLNNLRDCAKDGSLSPMRSALESCRDNIDGCLFSIMCDFSDGLGTMCVSEEIERCERAIVRLEAQYKKKTEEINSKTRLCRSVGCIVGIGLALLLW